MREKTLFIELFQPFAQYRNPFTFYYGQTYPLPPKSTIIGMLQNALNDWYGQGERVKKWWSLKVSIHGGFESIFWNYQQLIKGTKTGISLVRFRGRPTLWNQDRPLYGFPLTSQRSPVIQQELFNGWLYILIKGEEGFLNKIKDALEKPGKVLSLGRSEDVVFIRKTRFVREGEIKHSNAREIGIIYPTYVYVKDPEKILARQEYPVYYIPVRVIFRNNGKPVRRKAEINEKTFRDVEFRPVIHVGPWKYLELEKKVPFEEYRLNDMILRIPAGEEHKEGVSGWL
ncbi:type I-B CRISPR-associated protein Cas5b [Palaeococcus ferrophilus]|uniref:type I-B CRISPR-associated protein Cas5b n=1 Tax=Palaeococcus ferrophilus TaxID=83868 RepID=UPI0006974D33|nr:type I-B CRISPR-associated protein Cas5b [Palaeococcus ferrophilus]